MRNRYTDPAYARMIAGRFPFWRKKIVGNIDRCDNTEMMRLIRVER